jgi:hypothetical protein
VHDCFALEWLDYLTAKCIAVASAVTDDDQLVLWLRLRCLLRRAAGRNPDERDENYDNRNTDTQPKSGAARES